MIDIYRNGIIEESIDVDDSSTHQKSLSKFDKITLSFTLEQFKIFKREDYIEVDDVGLNNIPGNTKYYLFEVPKVQQVSVYSFKYTLVFSGKIHRLENIMFMLDDNSRFPFRGNADSLMTLMRINLQRVFGSGVNALSAATSPANIIYDFDFSDLNCLQALQLIASTFETEFQFYEVDKPSVRLLDVLGDQSNTFAYGYKNGIRKITSKPLNSKDLITRLYVLGSERNIDFNSYGSKRLKIAGLPYVENNVSEHGLIEGVRVFDEIYPRRTGSVTSITLASTTYKFTDSSMDFDVNAQLLSETAKITFNSGDLTGYEFEIASYDNTLKEFEIIKFTDDQNLTLPNSSIEMSPGDEYVIHDIRMPIGYVSLAETELQSKANDLISELSELEYEYDVESDPVLLRARNDIFDIGERFRLDLVDRGLGTIESRIESYIQKINKPYDFKLTLSTVESQGRLSRLNTKTNRNETRIRKESQQRKLEKYRSR